MFIMAKKFQDRRSILAAVAAYIDLSKEPLKVIAPTPELDASDLMLWWQTVEF